MNLKAQQIYFDDGSGSPTTGNLYYFNDNLGVGTSLPSERLHIHKQNSATLRLSTDFGSPCTAYTDFFAWDFVNDGNKLRFINLDTTCGVGSDFN